MPRKSKPKASTQVRKARNTIKSSGLNGLKIFMEKTGSDVTPELRSEYENLETKWGLRDGPKPRFK